MEKIMKSQSNEFLLKILELKTGRAHKTFKNEYFIIIKSNSILLGIKKIIILTKEEKRFISIKDYSIRDKYVSNIWIDASVSEKIREEFKDII